VEVARAALDDARAGALDIAFVPAGTAGYRDLKRDAFPSRPPPACSSWWRRWPT